MIKMFRTFALLLAGLLTLSLIVGCGGGDSDDEEAAAASFESANPPSGEIAANGTITVTFDNPPGADVKASAGSVTVAGKTATITGPFTPGALALTVTWADGSHTLNYTVVAADNDPPTITAISPSAVKDGGKDVPPEDVNADGIEITFSEDVTGNIALQTEDGTAVGWIGTVKGNKGMLELVAGKEIGNETTYVIKGTVKDGAGNELEVSVTFVTKGKE